MSHLDDLPPVNQATTGGAQRAAFVDLLDACEKDFGVPDRQDADDEPVGRNTQGGLALTFGLLRAARRSLGYPVVEYDPVV